MVVEGAFGGFVEFLRFQTGAVDVVSGIDEVFEAEEGQAKTVMSGWHVQAVFQSQGG